MSTSEDEIMPYISDSQKFKQDSKIKIISSGPNKDYYGKIIDLIEGCIVKLAINGKKVKVSEKEITVVSDDEYKQRSRVMNHAKFDKFIAKIRANRPIPTQSAEEEPKPSTSQTEDEQGEASTSRANEPQAGPSSSSSLGRASSSSSSSK